MCSSLCAVRNHAHLISHARIQTSSPSPSDPPCSVSSVDATSCLLYHLVYFICSDIFFKWVFAARPRGGDFHRDMENYHHHVEDMRTLELGLIKKRREVLSIEADILRKEIEGKYPNSTTRPIC